jgi:uncharacterized protein (TIGR00288 family)
MNDTRVALLIDADNLSGDVIEQAVEHVLKVHGAIHFRRAYSSAQKVIEHTELFRRHGIRPMVNVPTGKNSTDIALAVDAIDLAISERPDVVVIASSDSDYAPLAQRLREKGCRVLGIGQSGKTGSESPLAYDEFIDLAHRKSRSAPAAPARTAPLPAPQVAAAPRLARVPVPLPMPSRVPQPAPSPAPVRARAPARASRARATPPAPAAALVPEVLAILEAMPALRGGTPVQLNEVGEALRRHKILQGKSASPSRLLKRLSTDFELAPADKPRTVRFLKAAST